MHKMILAALLAAAPVAAAAQAPSMDTVLDRAIAAHRAARTVRATFEQTLTNSVTGSRTVSRGEFLQERPNLVAVRFTDPDGDRIIADGRAVWIYLPSVNPRQVIRTTAEQGAAAADPTAQFLDSPRTRYRISDGGPTTIEGRRTRQLTLVPRVPMAFERARVWIDEADGTLRQFEVTDANGVTRLVRLLSLHRNVTIDPAAFTFTPPPGVQVFEQ